MRIAKLITTFCLVTTGFVRWVTAADETPEQVKAREAVRQAVALQESSPASARAAAPAKEKHPAPAVDAAVIEQARQQVRQTIQDVESGKPVATGASTGWSTEQVREQLRRTIAATEATKAEKGPKFSEMPPPADPVAAEQAREGRGVRGLRRLLGQPKGEGVAVDEQRRRLARSFWRGRDPFSHQDRQRRRRRARIHAGPNIGGETFHAHLS